MLVITCITASFFLIREGKNIQGTIFGSAAAILALAVLVTRKQGGSNTQNNSVK